MFHGGRAQWLRGTEASMPHSDHSKEVCRPYGKNAASRVRQRYPLQKLSGASPAALQKALPENETKSNYSKLNTVCDNNKSPDSTSSNTFYHRGTNGIVCCLVTNAPLAQAAPDALTDLNVIMPRGLGEMTVTIGHPGQLLYRSQRYNR
jgi:hypothetical protein